MQNGKQCRSDQTAPLGSETDDRLGMHVRIYTTISYFKEMERVTRELEQTSERLEEAEKLNQRYQKELESVEGLHHKVKPGYWKVSEYI